jgi:hypothetical protein
LKELRLADEMMAEKGLKKINSINIGLDYINASESQKRTSYPRH